MMVNKTTHLLIMWSRMTFDGGLMNTSMRVTRNDEDEVFATYDIKKLSILLLARVAIRCDMIWISHGTIHSKHRSNSIR